MRLRANVRGHLAFLNHMHEAPAISFRTIGTAFPRLKNRLEISSIDGIRLNQDSPLDYRDLGNAFNHEGQLLVELRLLLPKGPIASP